MDDSGEPKVIDLLRQIHSDNPTCGEPRNQLLMQPEKLILYVRSLLCDEIPVPVEASPEEWGRVISSLRSHWILPFLYKKTRALPEGLRPPAAVMEALKTYYLKSFLRMAHSDHQLAELLDRFKNLGIPVMPLKGTAFSRTIDPDPAVRPGSDMDFLVRPEDVPRSCEALARIGYRCRVDYYAISTRMFSESGSTGRTRPGKACRSSSTGRCTAPGPSRPRTSGSCSPGPGRPARPGSGSRQWTGSTA